MNLVFDAGNNFIKAGIFDGSQRISEIISLEPERIKALVEEQQPEHIIVSSVNQNLEQYFKDFKGTIIFLNHATPIPIENCYQTPETLGMDRLAAVVGASQVFPKETTLVIDAGTCITYEIIENGKFYKGGSISPGISMRFKALNQFTGKLPLVEIEQNFPVTGTNTREAILSGVLNGLVNEATGIIQQYRQYYPGLKVIVCGGDRGFFENKLKEPIFVVPDLVLQGLNRILLYNVPL